jgi:A/G-specific adenine glycosylase
MTRDLASGAMEQINGVLTYQGHSIDLGAFRAVLVSWGRENLRSYPWRLTEDPYLILAAEIMLHRTQARQVVPIYERFIAAYPTPEALAQAEVEELHSALYSLGLRWRIELLAAMARDLMNRFGGQVPKGREDLLSLPGVSDYICSAVRCFAWGYPDPLVDTNTVRVVGRLFGLEVKDSSRRNRTFRELLTALVDPEQPQAYHYALLDLADTLCTKRRLPRSEQCPLLAWCKYGQSVVSPGNRQ